MTTGAGRVTAVVVVWNDGALTVGLLESLRASLDAGLRIVVVNNGSTDDSVNILESSIASSAWPSAIRLIHTGANLGFTGGVNAGTTAALAAEPPPEFVWLVNPDATAPTGTLEELVAVADDTGAEITTSYGLYWKPGAWPRAFFARPDNLTSRSADARWWPVARYDGACALFRNSLIEQLIARDGYFQDPGIYMYWDEWDCALRARELGATIVMARDARFLHLAETGSGPDFRKEPFRQYYLARNSVLLARRRMPAWQFWPALIPHLVRDLTWLARRAIRHDRQHFGAYLTGTLDGLRNRQGPWKHHPPGPPN